MVDMAYLAWRGRGYLFDLVLVTCLKCERGAYTAFESSADAALRDL